ncbi:MAG: RluA family pseudouridine synthase [Lachnospiraceae bacterium]|nr:RluA family pseudouridine synthase [Lachnospiraceae bacterium]
MESSGIRIVTWTVTTADAAAFSASAESAAAAPAAHTAIAGSVSHPSVVSARSGRTPLTVERFLRAKGCSHHVLTLLKRTDHGILLNGVWAYGNQPVHPGDEITIRVEEAAGSEQILPRALPLTIVYEDEDVLVADKPADMPVHPSAGNYENTLANAVMYYYSAKGIPFVFRCVTRLDRDTTGLVLLAKNSLSSAILSDQSAHRKIHREYLAITEGRLPESGTIDAPIARGEGSALMRCIDPERGERAVTHYQRLALFWRKPPASACYPDAMAPGTSEACTDSMELHSLPEVLSLARIHLETGRTHQIRVHMKSIGHPLPGDFLYNPSSVCARTPRQTLHAHRLTFAHPVTGKTLSFVSDLPADMRNLLEYDYLASPDPFP